MNYSYDVAISFAGENRKFAEAVAEGLTVAWSRWTTIFPSPSQKIVCLTRHCEY